jgi:N-methylhydantoinase A
MPLDAGLAVDACSSFGAPLGLDALEAAWGIREVAIATMARAVRTRIASRGLSGSDILLLAYGGCGGLFAADLARAAGAQRAVVPALAPVFSAHGAATASMRRERARSVAMALPGDTMMLQKVFRELTALVVSDLSEDAVAADRAVVGLEADLRFERQGAEITIPLVAVDGQAVVADLATRFRDEYVRRFGEGAVALGVTIEVMTVRAVGTARSDDASWPSRSTHTRRPEDRPAATNSRLVRVDRSGSHTVPVMALSDLVVGLTIEGPLLVDAGDTTIWIAPGCEASLDAHGSLVMEVPR